MGYVKTLKNSFSISHALPLKYYGEIAGYNWPDSWDFYAQMISGTPSETAAQRIAAVTEAHNAHYFIITDFPEFKLQKDLMSYLSTHFALWEQTPDYLIYDLTKPSSVQS